MRGALGHSGRRARCRSTRLSPLRPPRLEAPAPKRPSDVLVDAHCHLGDPAFDPDREAVLDRARDAGVTHVVVIGGTLAESDRAVALARARPGLSATVGVHPHEAVASTLEAPLPLRDLV